MKRFVLPLAALAVLLVPTSHAVAAPAHDTNDVSKIPPELCFAVTGSDVERILCSSYGPTGM